MILTEALIIWGWGFAVIMTLFFVVWIIAERTKNGGIVDVLWGIGFAVEVVLFSVLCQIFGFPVAILENSRAQILTLMVLAWSLRLAYYLLQRFRRLYPEEDPRYKAFREAWGQRASLGMFLAFQLQALLLASLCLPFAVVLVNTFPGVNPIELGAMILFDLSLVGEAIADSQLESFRKDPANKGKVCQVGLWNYSRHPNYFFEWLIWVSFFLYASQSPGGLYTVYCPFLMYFFLTRVTGVKATEEQSLRSKGEIYKLYQEATSAFFPWFKKKTN